MLRHDILGRAREKGADIFRGDPDEPPEPHVTSAQLSSGDMLLLCSDGLWNYAPTPSALGALSSNLPTAAPAIEVCAMLVRYANNAGGRDNITAAILITSAAGVSDLATTGKS